MENKNIIRTFYHCKFLKKDIEPHQNVTGSDNKVERHWTNFKIDRILKGKKVNKLCQK